MKAFEVTGYYQYDTDAASSVKRVQIAETAEEAIEQVINSFKASYRSGNFKYVLNAKEL